MASDKVKKYSKKDPRVGQVVAVFSKEMCADHGTVVQVDFSPMYPIVVELDAPTLKTKIKMPLMDHEWEDMFVHQCQEALKP